MPLRIRPVDPNAALERIARLLESKQRATAAAEATWLAQDVDVERLRELVALLAGELFAIGDAQKPGRPAHSKAMRSDPDAWALALMEGRAQAEVDAAIVAYRLMQEAKQGRGKKLTPAELQPLLWATGIHDIPPDADPAELRAALLPHATKFLDDRGLIGKAGRTFPTIAREVIAARLNEVLKGTSILAISPEKLR